MEDPNLIATLIPVDKWNYAEHAFSHFENIKRCLPPTTGFNDEPVIGSKEPTPARSLSPNDNTEDYRESRHRLLLTFDTPPKDLGKGFAFGTDEQRCDVVLASRGIRATSGVHFHISFHVINEKIRLVLTDASTRGTAVSYSGQARKEMRRGFTWILDLKKCDRNGRITGKWEVEVNVRKLEFKVELATHDTCEAEYKENVDKFLKLNRTADPHIGGMGLHSPTEPPSQSLSPQKHRVYISEGNIGKGSFGKVDRVIDVSTGAIYARKTFFDPGKHERKRWLDDIRREIRIMKEHPHEHIVQLKDAREEPPPFLMMSYLHLGSLRDENSRLPLIDEEVTQLLIQGLSVLEHLHSRSVAYRDLKPDNILVEGRSPLRVRFTDFGLANDQPDLKTFCGSEQYAAPEIFIGGNYTAAVDIWSLGVIVLEYVYGLPTQCSQARMGGIAAMKERGLAWCRSLVEYANDWDSDGLVDLLVTAMLRMEPQARLSADACLKKGHELGVFEKSSMSSGCATPTRTKPPASAVRNEEETPTIIEGPLWHARRVSANHDDDDGDDNDQMGRPASDRRSTTSMSRPLDVLGSHNNKDSPWPRKETPRAIFDRSSGHVRSSLEPSFGSKRHRSPAASLLDHPSDQSRIKRRPAEAPSTEVRIT